MSKKQSSESLVKLTHEQDIESLELNERVELLTEMLEHPTKSKRDTYVAQHLYDEKGNLDTDHWEYQLVGVASLTSVPVTLIFGSAIGATIARGIDVNGDYLLATGGMVLAEIAAIAGTNAYMTKKGSKMAADIKTKLTANLEELGYQITPKNEPKVQSVESYETNNERLLDGKVISTGNNKYVSLIEEDEFVAKVASLIQEINESQYPRYEDDTEELRELALDWISLNAINYRKKGRRLDYSFAPTYVYESIRESAHSKINKTLKKISR